MSEKLGLPGEDQKGQAMHLCHRRGVSGGIALHLLKAAVLGNRGDYCRGQVASQKGGNLGHQCETRRKRDV